MTAYSQTTMLNSASGLLITIVMPVYNAERYIAKALDNISAQTFQQFELLVIDAVSTDETVRFVQTNQTLDKRIHFISEKDKGIYDAMNKGITLAKGEWLYFMGCDDNLYDPDVLTKISSHLNENVDLVYGDSIWEPDGQMERGNCGPRELVHRNINHQRVFYRKCLFEKWGNYDLKYKIASDHELNIRFFCNTQIRKKYIPIAIARFNSEGFSANKLDEVFWNNWKSIFRNNLATYIPEKVLYHKLGWYCRYHLDQKNYKKSFLLFMDVFFHTFSPGFVLLTARHLMLPLKNYAG